MTSFALNQPLRRIIQHYLNSLHVYSLICRLRFSRDFARKLASMYERVVHPLLYGSRISDKLINPVLLPCRENTGIAQDIVRPGHAVDDLFS